MISVICVVKNERGIEETLTSLAVQTIAKPYEVIVVDASDTVPLTDIAKRFPHVRWLPYKHPHGKGFTIPEQRNVGLHAAKGDIIAFVDAGCNVAPDWLQKLTGPIAGGRESFCAGSIVANDSRLFNSYQRRHSYAQEAPGGNVAMHKKVFETVGDYDESLTYGEDVDLSWRAVDAGFAICVVPDAVAMYDFGTLQRRLKRTIRYGAARVPLYAKHRSRLKKIMQHEPATVIYPVYLLGLPLAFLWPFYPLLLGLLFIKNIKHQPLRTLGNNLLFGVGVIRGVLRLATQRQGNRKAN